METGETTTAEELINEAVSASDGSSVLSRLERRKEELEAGEREKVDRYIGGMREVFRSMVVRDFAGNTAGLYDGSRIYLDRGVAMVGSSVDETIDRSGEVFEHEKYHEENDHTAPLKVVADTRGDVAAVIGGVEFSETALIEGLTVRQTGERFVSGEYVGYRQMVDRALGASGLSLGELERAVNEEKDLTAIDDRAGSNALAA